MTDRYNVLTVVLDEPIRDDDCQPIINAIKQIRHVAHVTGKDVDNFDVHAAKAQLQLEWTKKLWALLREEFTP